jgi:HK97 family phage portal protein
MSELTTMVRSATRSGGLRRTAVSAVGGQKAMGVDELSRLLVGYYGGGESASGESVTPASAMRSATVHACVRVLAEDVGKLPLILYRRTTKGKERATDHPLYHVLRTKPNAWQTPISFFGMGQAHIELRGAAYAYITRVRGQVRELLPIATDRMRVEQQEDWSVKYYIRLKAGEKEIAANELLHVPGLSLDGVCGVSPIAFARESIGLALAMEKHGGRLFKNSARPSGVLQRPKEAPALSRPAAQLLIDSFNASYSGDGAKRTVLLEEGVTFNPVTMTSEDAQFLETRQYQRTEICGVFRVPPPKIGDHTRSTFNNIEQLSLDYLTDSLMPRLVRWEQAMNRALLSPAEQEEYFVEFLVDAVLRTDVKSRMESYALAIQNGILSPNEARVKENLNPREGGDVFLTPMNMAPNSPPKEKP